MTGTKVVETGPDFIALAWDPWPGATRYQILVDLNESGEWGDHYSPEPSFRLEGLEPGVLVKIVVRVRELAGNRTSGWPWPDPVFAVASTSAEGEPCSGVTVVAAPPIFDAKSDNRWLILATTLTILVDADAAAGAAFDWERPYYHGDGEWWVGTSPALEASAAEWEIESLPKATRHTIRIEWLHGKTLRLGFRSTPGTCHAERHQLECRADGCILRGAS